MKTGLIIFIISVLSCVKAIEDSCAKVPEHGNDLTKLISSIRQFSKTVVKHVREIRSGNYVVSPLSLHLALGMITIGSDGSTAAELHKALGTNKIKRGLVEYYRHLSEELWNIYSYFRLSHKLWLSNKFTPRDTFISLIRDSFANSAISVLNFNNTQSATEIMNYLRSASFSSGNFNKFMKNGEISRDTSLIISSVLNFQGTISNSLKVKRIEVRKFFISEGITKEVPMMHIQGPVLYGLLSDIKASFIKYRTKNRELSIIIIRSNAIQDFETVDKQLDNINISEILKHGKTVNSSFFLPTFKLQSTLELKEIVQKMGVHEIFSTKANLRGISHSGLKVDQIIQKIHIDTNYEERKIPSLADIHYKKRTPRNATRNMDVNSPFHFLLFHEQTNLPLVRGRVVNPSPN